MLSRKKKVESVRNEQLNPIAMPQRGRYGAINVHKAPYTREKIHRDVYTSNRKKERKKERKIEKFFPCSV